MSIPLISTLVSLGVFTDFDRQRVEAIKVHFRRNEEILNILSRKSRRHFDKFIEALKKTYQKHVADLFKVVRINGTLNAISGHDSAHEQQFVESVLLSRASTDLNQKSVISQQLHDKGIHEAGVSSVEPGYTRIWFKFSSRETLDVIRSDELDKLFTEKYYALLCDKGIPSIRIEIQIPDEEFERCEQAIGECEALMTPEHKHDLELAIKKIPDKISADKDFPLCQCSRDVIVSQSSNEDKAKVLLDVMTRRPDCEFQQLLDFLTRKEQNVASGKSITLCLKKSDPWD